jgi:hypothetical protein
MPVHHGSKGVLEELEQNVVQVLGDCGGGREEGEEEE